MDYQNSIPEVAVIDGHIVSDKYLVTQWMVTERFAEMDRRMARLYQTHNIARAALADVRYYQSNQYVVDRVRAAVAAWWDRTWPRLMLAGFCAVIIATAIASLATR